jgi:hypothetical protein
LNDFSNTIRPPGIAHNEDGFAAFYDDIVADIDVTNDDKDTTNNTNDENPIEPIEPVVNTIRRDEDSVPAINDNGHFAGLIKIDNVFRKRPHG